MGRYGFSAPQTSRPAGFDAVGWKEHHFAEGQLTISLPGSPTVEKLDSKENKGQIFVVHAELPGSDIEFFVQSTPGKSVAALPGMNALQNELLAEFPGSRILSARTLRWEGRPGLEFHVKTPSAEVIRRVLSGNGRWYSLSAGGSSLAPYDQSVKHFLLSFASSSYGDSVPAAESIPEPLLRVPQ